MEASTSFGDRPLTGGPATPPIIVADDDRAARELVLRLFRKLNLVNPILTAEDGEQAIAILQTTRPALVLLDITMPRSSGLDVLTHIRTDKRLADVPVIMLSGTSDLADVDAAYSLGVVSYLVKPVGFVALRDVVHELGLPWVLLARGADRGEADLDGADDDRAAGPGAAGDKPRAMGLTTRD